MTGSTGRILGASTFAGAGIASLPKTSGTPILFAISIIAISSGALVLLAFAASRITRAVIAKRK